MAGLDKFMDSVSTTDTKKMISVGQDICNYLGDPDSSIECEDMGAFIDAMVPWMQSSNVKVSQNGLDIVGFLIDRLASDFRPYLNTILSTVVDRLGDTREVVREKANIALHKLMDATISPQPLFEKISGAFSHKNGEVREEVMLLLQNTLKAHGAQSLTVSKLIPAIVMSLADPMASVRDAAVSTLVEIYRHVGERVRMHLQKKQKIPKKKLAMIMSKFDEVRTSGNMMPTATLAVGTTEVRKHESQVEKEEDEEAQESRQCSPPAGIASLSRNSESTLLGRVRSLAISEEGSKFLVSVMNQETVPTIQEELLTDGLSVMLDPVSSKVMQAVVEATEDIEEILEIVLDNFQILSSDRSGSRIIKHALTRLPSSKKSSIVAKLEKEEILADLLSSQQGTNVAQACIPHMTESSVASIVKFVLRNLVELGNNPNGSYFIQLFMTSSNPSINKASKDSVLDAIVENVENLLKEKFGSCLMQTALKVPQSPRHIFLFSAWVKDNIEEVYCDPDAVRFASSVIEVLVNLSNSEEADLGVESEKILRELILLMMDTLVEVDDSTVPLLVAASFDPYGHVLARKVCLQARFPEIRNKFIQLFSQYKSKLEDDTFGSLVLKGLQGLL